MMTTKRQNIIFLTLTWPFLFALALNFPDAAYAGKHALVISNGSYEHLNNLRNTHSDGDAYSSAFENVGFDIVRGTDLNRRETNFLIYDFLENIQPGDEVAFVYAGHGWSNLSSNFIIPTDTPVASGNISSGYYESETIDIQKAIIAGMRERGAKLVVAIIDACRTNPFMLKNGRGAIGLNRGLVSMEAGEGTFIVYSAASGQEALDGLPNDPPSQRLSVFTRHFVERLKPGVFLHDAVLETRMATTRDAKVFANHKQRPSYYDETSERICLAGSCTSAGKPVLEEIGSNAENRGRYCERLYRISKDIQTCRSYQSFLEQCEIHRKHLDVIEVAQENCAGINNGQPRKLGLVVGIDDYLNLKPHPAPAGEMSDLNGAVNDALRVAGSLRRVGFDLPDKNLLIDKRATKESFLQRFSELVSSSTYNDLIFVHLSGHGEQFIENEPQARGFDLGNAKLEDGSIWEVPIESVSVTKSHANYSPDLIANGVDETKDGVDEGFLFVEYDPRNPMPETLLDDELFDLLPDESGPTVLIFFDIVYSRGMLDIGVLHPKLGFGMATISEDRLLTETRINGKSHAAFSYFLAEALSGEADTSQDGWLTWAEIESYVEEAVFAHMRQNQLPSFKFGGDAEKKLIKLNVQTR